MTKIQYKKKFRTEAQKKKLTTLEEKVTQYESAICDVAHVLILYLSYGSDRNKDVILITNYENILITPF